MKQQNRTSVRLKLIKQIVSKTLGVTTDLTPNYSTPLFWRYNEVNFFEVSERALCIGIHKMLNGGAHILFINCSLKKIKYDLERTDGRGKKIYPDVVISFRRPIPTKEMPFEIINVIVRPEIGQDIDLLKFNKESLEIFFRAQKFSYEMVIDENAKITGIPKK